MQTPLISVIVPVYNVEPYLRRCVDSILRQTYRNLEILLVDDGSTDRSGTICDACAQQDTRVKVIHQKNQGQAAARNHGIDQAKGEYLSFVDSDDFIEERMLETLCRDAAEAGVMLAAAGFRKVSDAVASSAPTEGIGPEIMSGKEAIDSLLLSEEIGDFPWNKLYDRGLFDGIRYPEGYIFEDLGTTYRLVERCPRISFRREALYNYYQRADSTLNQTKKMRFYENKFDMGYSRYVWLRERYGDFLENDAALLSNIEHCWPYLAQEEERREKMEAFLRQMKPEAARLLCPSSQRKYRLLRFSRKLYAKLFVLKNGPAADAQ